MATVPLPSLFAAQTATDIAPVAAIPTTAAQFALWNGESPGGKTYYITSLGWTTTTSAAAVLIGQLLAAVVPGNQSIISGTALNGPLAIDGTTAKTKALAFGAVTLTAAQQKSAVWHIAGPSIISAAMTATIAQGQWANVSGIYRLAPGSILCAAVLCSAAGSAKCVISCTWAEQ